MDKIEWLYQLARDPRWTDQHRDLAARAVARAGSAGEVIAIGGAGGDGYFAGGGGGASVSGYAQGGRAGSIRAQISRDVAIEFARETLTDYDAGPPAGADVCMWHAQMAGRLASDCQHLLDEVTR